MSIEEYVKAFEDKYGITKNREIAAMSREYEKGGSFTAYVDKAVRNYNTTPEIEIKKEITKEYYRSLKGGCNEDTIRDANDRTDTNQDSYKPACDS